MNTDSETRKLSRKEREFQARRQEILEAATRIFAQKGYHGTAMSEIAQEAEFSTGSLYNFFKNKEELYFSLLQSKVEALEILVEEVYTSSDPLDQVLKRFLDTVLTFFDREQDFFRIFVEHRTTFETAAKGEFADVVHDKMRKYVIQMVMLMDRGVKGGVLNPLPPEELAMIFMGIMNAFIIIFVNRDSSGKLSDKSDQILDAFFNGTRKR